MSIQSRAVTRAERAFGQALWYAFGRQDAGQGKGINAFAFAESVKRKQYEFETEKTHSIKSIQDLWLDFVKENS